MLFPKSACVRVLPPRTNKQANGWLKFFLTSALTGELTFKSSWLYTRLFLTEVTLCAGRVCALTGRSFCAVVWFGCGWRESSERVIPLEFSYTSELNMDAGRVWLRLLSPTLNPELWNGTVESREPSDAEDLSHRATDSHHDSGLVVDGLLLSLSSPKKPEGMGVQGGAEWAVDGRMEKKADEETTPTEKQLRTGGDMSPRGRTVLHVRAPEKVERRGQLLFIAWIGGGGGLDRGKGEGRTILGRITWFFWGDGWEISRRQQECPPTEFKRWTIGGIIRTLQNLRGEQILRSPPLPSHGDKQIRPQNQHYQRKNSVALETIKLCVKRSSHFCQRNISR